MITRSDYEMRLEKVRIEEYKLGWQRYEKLRKLSPVLFKDLWLEALNSGKPFDELVDALCPKCSGPMEAGKAIEQTFTGSPDFTGGPVVTMSPGGTGRMIDCMKCKGCGWSVTI
jgi:hypothetical protein